MESALNRRLLRHSVGVIDAGVSSLSNTVIQIVAAALLAAHAFGLFSLAVATGVWLIGAARGAIGEVDLLRGSRSTDSGPLAAVAAISIPLLASGIVLLGGAVAAQSEQGKWVAIALVLSPVLVVQDALRYRAFRMDIAPSALIGDSVWLAVIALGSTAAFIMNFSAGPLFALWILGAASGACFQYRSVGTIPGSLSEGKRWFANHRDLIRPIGWEYLLRTGVPYASNFIVIGVGGLEALAGYRLAQVIFGPSTVLASGINAVAAPEMADPQRRHQLRERLNFQIMAAIVSTAAIMTLALLLPERVGSTLFGQSFSQLGPFLIPVAIHATINAASVPNSTAIRILGLARKSLHVRIVSTPISVVALAVGAHLLGGAGVAWALALTAAAAYGVRAGLVRLALSR